MRWRKADLRRRVNGNLTLRFEQRGLTSYGGLEFVRRYFDLLGVVPLLRRELGSGLPRSDFGVPGMVLVLLALVAQRGAPAAPPALPGRRSLSCSGCVG